MYANGTSKREMTNSQVAKKEKEEDSKSGFFGFFNNMFNSEPVKQSLGLMPRLISDDIISIVKMTLSKNNVETYSLIYSFRILSRIQENRDKVAVFFKQKNKMDPNKQIDLPIFHSLKEILYCFLKVCHYTKDYKNSVSVVFST